MALSKIDVANMLTGVTPVANGGTAATTFAAAGLGKRPNATPLIINGDMAVAQRSTSSTGNTGSGYHACDRMAWSISGIGTYTVAQESLTSGAAFEAGFANAVRIDTTTADASPASADYLYMQYNFEGQDLQLFKKGTSSAEKFTLAFWVKSNKTGQANVEFKDKDNSNRHAIGSYTISSADTWEHKIVVINADTTGAFGDDNGKSMNINWWLDSGDNYTGVTEGDAAWLALDDDRANNDGALQIARNTANDWAITGIQLEVGEYTSSTLPPFQHESFGDNLHRCRRYTQLHMNTDENGGPFLGLCFAYAANNWQSQLLCNPPMRIVPAVTSVNSSNAYVIFSNGGTINYNQIDLNDATVSGNVCTIVDLSLDGADGGTAGHAGKTRGNSTGAGTMCLLSSEL
jgi:hypothetical protein